MLQVEASTSRLFPSWEASQQEQQEQEIADQQQHTSWAPVAGQQLHHDEQQDAQDALPLKASGCKKGGRPVTWIGGGGMDPKKLASMGVPQLRALFSHVFGQQTASNNAAWLRRKLAESPDSVHGQRRSPVVRARDVGAAIWQDEHEWPTDEAGQHQQLAAASEEQQQQHDAAESRRHRQQVQPALLAGEGVVVLRTARTPSSSPSVSGLSSGAWARTAAPVGADSAAPPTRQGKRPRASSFKAQQQQATAALDSADASAYAAGVPITPDSLDSSCLGQRVLVYWPADCQWWEATISQLDVAAQRIQLAYADATEESVTGRDFLDLLGRGHLLALHDTSSTATGSGTCSDASQQRPLLRLHLGNAASAPSALTLPGGAAEAGGLASTSSGRSTAFRRSASGFAHGCFSDAEEGSTAKRARLSGDGGNNSSSGSDAAGMAAARHLDAPQPQWMLASNAARMLGATFASEQLQQLHLQQQQATHDAQLQQQAHMQMQMAAGQFMLQQQLASATDPSCFMMLPPAAAAAQSFGRELAQMQQLEVELDGMDVQIACDINSPAAGAPTRGCGAADTSSAPAGAACEQVRKCVRFEAAPAAAAANGGDAAAAKARLQQRRPRTPALPALSGNLSGFAGLGRDAYDEVDTLLGEGGGGQAGLFGQDWADAFEACCNEDDCGGCGAADAAASPVAAFCGGGDALGGLFLHAGGGSGCLAADGRRASSSSCCSEEGSLSEGEFEAAAAAAGCAPLLEAAAEPAIDLARTFDYV